MSYTEGEELTVTVDGEEREVTLETVTADGLLLVSDGDERFTAGQGEVTGRELTFGVYPDADGPFAVMNQERPDIPRGALADIQDEVDEAVHDDRLTVDGEIPEAGKLIYEPGRDDGRVREVKLTAQD